MTHDPQTKPEIDAPTGPAPDELQITDITVGDGDEATAGSTVKVHYVGVEHDSDALGCDVFVEPVRTCWVRRSCTRRSLASSSITRASFDNPRMRSSGMWATPWKGSRWCWQSDWNGMSRARTSSS